MCRALYKITTQPSAPAWVTFEMIDEAYNLMNTALSVNEENAEVHKWLAIILSIKSSYSNTSARVESSHVIKHHLMVINYTLSTTYLISVNSFTL